MGKLKIRGTHFFNYSRNTRKGLTQDIVGGVGSWIDKLMKEEVFLECGLCGEDQRVRNWNDWDIMEKELFQEKRKKSGDGVREWVRNGYIMVFVDGSRFKRKVGAASWYVYWGEGHSKNGGRAFEGCWWG